MDKLKESEMLASLFEGNEEPQKTETAPTSGSAPADGNAGGQPIEGKPEEQAQGGEGTGAEGTDGKQPADGNNTPTEVTPQASTIDEIKEFVGKNADITDWPKEQLDKLVGYLNTLDEFKNSKKAQAAIQAIQQAETENGEGGGEKPAEAGAEGTGADKKTEAPAEEKSNAPAGNAANVPEGDLTTVISRLTNLGNTYTVDDLAAALKAKGKK